MCGFVGWYATASAEGEPPSRERLDAAAACLANRGPDGEGAWVAPDGRCGLAHRRLAILDLEGGAQPMASPDGRWTVAFNGEIFNFPDLRRELEQAGEAFTTRSDTEVLLRLLALRGTGAVQALRGQFAFAAYDAAEGALLLARDALGEKPLFTARHRGWLWFGSTIEAVLTLGDLPRDVDPEAVSHYLSFSYIPAPWTIHRAVRKLPAGHLLTASARGLWAPELWWVPPTPGTFDGSFDDAVDALGETLGRAVKRRLLADVPVGAFLSSGLDSTAVVAAARHEVGDLRTFSVRHPDPAFDESADAARIAAHLGTEHTTLDAEPPAPGALTGILEAFGEPFGDSSASVTAAIAQAARTEVTVALTGDGGDEVLGGYHRHAYLSLVDRLPAGTPGWVRGGTRGRVRRALDLAQLPEERRYYEMYECFPQGGREALLRPDFAAEFGDTPAMWLTHLYLQGGGDAPLDRMQRVDLLTHLPDYMNVKVDVATMRHSLEARSPFQEREMVELGVSLPAAYKVRGFRGKRVLRALVEREVPRGLLARRKRGFAAPVDAALRGPLRAEAARLLAPDGPLAGLEVVRPEVPAALLAEHLEGRANHRIRLWVLLALAWWAASGD